MTELDTLIKILDLARWAPSGDNAQSWRLSVHNARHVTLYCQDTRDHCVYDLHGHPSQIAFGAFLETLAIAASSFGWGVEAQREGTQQAPIFQLTFDPQAGKAPNPLAGAIKLRTVQRRPMRTRPLTAEEKNALAKALGEGFEVQWLEGSAKWPMARLMYRNARLRLTMPEAFETHRSIIEWNARHSETMVPDQALGLDAMTVKLMRWAMHSWQRMHTINTLLGTWSPRLQMDLLPGMACAAHFVIRAARPLDTIDDYVAAGRAVQRFWLELTRLDLCMQPEMTPLIFDSYLRQQPPIEFTADQRIMQAARSLQAELHRLVGSDTPRMAFMGRLGAGPRPQARSLRRSLGDLIA